MPAAKDILGTKTPGAFMMDADDSVLNAALLMTNLRIGALVITDKGKIGIFTERDLLRRVVAQRRDPASATLRDVMTSPVVTCRPETSLFECLAVLERKNVRHLPIVDDTGVCGLITNRDIAAFIKAHGP